MTIVSKRENNLWQIEEWGKFLGIQSGDWIWRNEIQEQYKIKLFSYTRFNFQDTFWKGYYYHGSKTIKVQFISHMKVFKNNNTLFKDIKEDIAKWTNNTIHEYKVQYREHDNSTKTQSI